MGQMKFNQLGIKGIYIVEPQIFWDRRGFFMETYNEKDFEEVGLNINFVQDNQSFSKKGVIRGLNFQVNHPQTKLVRVLSGEIFDVAVDLRKDSETYCKWVGTVLSADNQKQLLIPKGFAHGFAVLSDYAQFAYKCDDFYYPEDECGILWNDPDINVAWPKFEEIFLSEKDKSNPTFKDLLKSESR